MPYSKYVSQILINSGCYVHANNENNLIKIPTGDQVIVYLSCRLLISNVKERELIEKMLTERVKNSFPSNVTIAGIATAGITWGHAIASNLKLPMLYTRNSDKKYGLGGQVEGNISSASDEVILVDDVLFTGDSIITAQSSLESKGKKVIGIVCIAILNDKIADYFKEKGIKVIGLTNYMDILTTAEENYILNKEEVVLMKKIYERRVK